MSIHVLFIALILGFAAVAGFSARSTVRNTFPESLGNKNNLAYIWVFGGMAVFFTTVLIAGYGQTTFVFSPATLYPLFALLMIAGAYTIAWYVYKEKMKVVRYRRAALSLHQRPPGVTRRRRRRQTRRTRVRR